MNSRYQDMSTLEQHVRDFFTAHLGGDGLSVVIPIEPSYWLHPALPHEQTKAHIPFGFRAPLSSELVHVEVSGDLIGMDTDPGIYTFICPKLITGVLATQPPEIVDSYLDTWLQHLCYHIMLEPCDGDIEAEVDEMIMAVEPEAISLMSGIQMRHLDALEQWQQ